MALLTTLAACSNDDDDPVAEPAPAATESAAPSEEPAPTTNPDASGPEAGYGVGAVNVRSVHLTSWAWGDAATKDPVVALIKAGKLDNVQLDIKDEDGIVGYDSQVPLAVEAKTVYKPNGTARFDLAATVKEIHDLGATITGRIVAFRDPRLGKWALNAGKMDMLIQDSAGKPYPAGNYGVGAFTNFANNDVMEYNIQLAEEAAKAGFDAIMYDYVRKPENSGQVYPGIGDKTPAEGITAFLAKAAPRIRAAGAAAGAAVYGISSFAPSSVAQDIPAMAKVLDFVSPMIYPSHWNKGEYSVASPVDQPYDIVKQSMMDFNRMMIGTKCQVVPWLQNFSWPKTYTAADVAAQIKAVKDTGINSWYLWNDSSKVGIGAPALQPGKAEDNKPGQILYSINKPGNKSEGSTDIEKARKVFEAYLAWLEGGRQGTFKNPLDEPAATPEPTSSSSDSESSPEPSATATP
ncbi:hypothetical protein GCM10009547_34620 [Sporichthya brevicatena]|uniref:DUF4015 domain-containing protein n=1 Tax=Sporichthya brevicatena TaxID=171442 RepID=A0ABP3SCX3_9ACTN